MDGHADQVIHALLLFVWRQLCHSGPWELMGNASWLHPHGLDNHIWFPHHDIVILNDCGDKSHFIQLLQQKRPFTSYPNQGWQLRIFWLGLEPQRWLHTLSLQWGGCGGTLTCRGCIHNLQVLTLALPLAKPLALIWVPDPMLAVPEDLSVWSLLDHASSPESPFTHWAMPLEDGLA